MYARDEKEYFTAKRKAAKMVVGSDRLRDLPSNREIREHIIVLAELLEGESRRRDLRAMRLEALRFLRLLSRWRPQLIGSVWTGHVRKGSDIDIHVFCDHPEAVAQLLEAEGYQCLVERKRVLKHHEERVFTHIHVKARFDVELTVYARDKANYPFRSSITGRAIERADVSQLETLLREEAPEADLEADLADADRDESVRESDERWALYEALLRPLEAVKQNPRFHPEGDALYHSLQVFGLAREVRGYDQEFMLAALLHDVGKAIDPADHVRAGMEALEGAVSDRTAWLIEHHMDAHSYRDGSLGARARRRLEQSDDFDDLMLLSEIDKAGRARGATVVTVGEALEVLRSMDSADAPDPC